MERHAAVVESLASDRNSAIVLRLSLLARFASPIGFRSDSGVKKSGRQSGRPLAFPDLPRPAS
jgi:hypothetical protein